MTEELCAACRQYQDRLEMSKDWPIASHQLIDPKTTGKCTCKARKMPMFQQRHVETIATIMAAIKPNEELPGGEWRICQWIATVNALTTLFKHDNPHFMPNRFKRTCEGER